MVKAKGEAKVTDMLSSDMLRGDREEGKKRRGENSLEDLEKFCMGAERV
jgi:hypothetical protein